MLLISSILHFIILISNNVSSIEKIDPKGYILYCPCMGRFGNQAEQLLGSLQFAKALDRTLVLPPFIEYHKSQVNFIPFQTLIDVNRLQSFHKVITIQDFMHSIAPVIWKSEKRPIFCYSKRPGKDDDGCNPCEGNPFESFWKQLNITSFSSSVFYGPLTTDYRQATDWINQYSGHKVLTFVGAPSSFPVNKEAVQIQEYISFSQDLVKASNDHKMKRKIDEPYIGVHLRWGSDWQRTCNLLEENPMKTLFSSSQCSDGHHVLPPQLCIQDIDLITANIERVLAERHNISTVYIASDLDDQPAWQSIYDSIKIKIPDLKLFTPRWIYGNSPQTFEEPTHFTTDLYLLSLSDIFIGNCISSFSAFVSRIRTFSLKKPADTTRFFGIEFPKTKLSHEEL